MWFLEPREEAMLGPVGAAAPGGGMQLLPSCCQGSQGTNVPQLLPSHLSISFFSFLPFFILFDPILSAMFSYHLYVFFQFFSGSPRP